MRRSLTLICIWLFISLLLSSALLVVTSPQLSKKEMLTSAQICFCMLFVQQRWTVCSRASVSGPYTKPVHRSCWYLISVRSRPKNNLITPCPSSATNGRGLLQELRSWRRGWVSAPHPHLVTLRAWLGGLYDVTWFVRVWVVYNHHLRVNYLGIFFFMTGWKNLLDGIIYSCEEVNDLHNSVCLLWLMGLFSLREMGCVLPLPTIFYTLFH